MEINWFPGHMAKALRKIEENLKLVDMVIETCDARIPQSSRNPALDEIIGDKPRLLVLNKADLADEIKTREWVTALNDKGIRAIAQNGMKIADTKVLKTECRTLCSAKIERAMQKGRRIRPVRAMVVGIPNSGKSTIINTLSKRKAAKTSDRPGITRAPQWIRAGEELELMDMPGVLWPKIDQRTGQILLAGTGAIRDTVIDSVEVAYEMMLLIAQLYPRILEQRYGIDFEEVSGYDAFELAAKKRGCVMSGGRIDEVRFSSVFLDEIRGGIAGRMTFERPSLKENGF